MIRSHRMVVLVIDVGPELHCLCESLIQVDYESTGFQVLT